MGYKCLICGEIFPNQVACAIHHLNTKHEHYKIRGTDCKFTIKS